MTLFTSRRVLPSLSTLLRTALSTAVAMTAISTADEGVPGNDKC